MKTKNKILLKISWYIGLIAFVGGWSIFLVWTVGRFAGAWDFDDLEILGIFWVLGFFWLALIALLLLLIYVLINRKNLHLMMLYAGIIILINIPSVPIIIRWHGNIEKKVFVKLINHTEHKLTNITLHGNLKTWRIGDLNITSSKVINYDPPYRTNDARLYQKPDTLRLIFTHNEVIDTVGFPTIRMGDCKQLIIDENLKIKAHNNGEHEEPL